MAERLKVWGGYAWGVDKPVEPKCLLRWQLIGPGCVEVYASGLPVADDMDLLRDVFNGLLRVLERRALREAAVEAGEPMDTLWGRVEGEVDAR